MFHGTKNGNLTIIEDTMDYLAQNRYLSLFWFYKLNENKKNSKFSSFGTKLDISVLSGTKNGNLSINRGHIILFG